MKPKLYRFIVKIMKRTKNEIRLYSSDENINSLINRAPSQSERKVTLHFDHNEDFFLKLPESVTVPHFPIHHNIDQTSPNEEYIKKLYSYLEELVPMVPEVFRDLTYFFDPADIIRPGFFHLYRLKDQLFLYLLRIDLNFRTHYCEIIEKGGNDSTHTYSTTALFLENDIIPLDSVGQEKNKLRTFFIEQHLSDTWIGESGKGYFVQGIWIDRDLTKFFSKLFLPSGKRTYPYYPFPCKYQTICHSVLDYSPEGRKKHLKLLYQARNFLKPYFEEIQSTLSKTDFSEELPLFKNMKTKISSKWNDVWSPLNVEVYLNKDDMKEFQIDFASK